MSRMLQNAPQAQVMLQSSIRRLVGMLKCMSLLLALMVLSRNKIHVNTSRRCQKARLLLQGAPQAQVMLQSF